MATSSYTVFQSGVPLRSMFVTTHWSTVLRAGNGDARPARDALEKLCRTYWYPIYACIRRRGHSPEDAQDLTQSFFLRLLEHQSLAKANLGRFRSFLLGALNHFLIDEWKKARAQWRGGSRQICPHGSPSRNLSDPILLDQLFQFI